MVQLLYDVLSPQALPYWLYVLDGAAPGCDRLLLPERDGFAALRAGPARRRGGSPVDRLEPVPRASGWTPPDPNDNSRRRREAEREGEERRARFSLTVGERIAPFLGDGRLSASSTTTTRSRLRPSST